MERAQKAEHFDRDGSLRDLYVLETAMADWRVMWNVLRRLDPLPKFLIDLAEVPLPRDVESAFDLYGESTLLLCVQRGRVTFNCHFFREEEIEFDCDPREIETEEDIGRVAEFMQLLGVATGKEIILTHENSKDLLIASFAPGSAAIEWVDPRT